MPDLIREYSTANIPTADIGQVVDELMTSSKDARKPHERRWYDNQFFYDGYHFRYLSRTQNKIVDLSDRATLWSPMRAIPKASRQLDGVANLLVSQDYTPVIYPEKIDKLSFPDPQEYQSALDEAKRVAKQSGHWIEEEFKKQNLLEKIAHMVTLSGIGSVAWLQIWADPVDEKINTQVYDAFDIYTIGTLTEIDDAPYIIKGIPMIISRIKANENYDEDQLKKISPDNKHASSEIKEAYMRTRYGRDYQTDQSASLILKDAILQEYLGEDNRDRIALQEDGGEILQGKKTGDPVFRQIHVAGNVWLMDKYINLPSYPYIDFRFKPGPIYQTPLIERFIPQNKSYDMLVSRAERYSHTMVTGSWSQKQGEQYEINNSAGGQILKYQSTPPVQNQIASIPSFYFNLMSMIQNNIEEQGVSTSILGKVPQGVKANAAIESLKESEYASLVIAQRRLKGTVQRIAEKMLDIADQHYVTPQTTYYLEKGEPQYFDVIGATGLKKREELNLETTNAIPLKKDYRVEIEVQAGMAYTREGKKAAARELGDYMVQLAQLGVLPPQVVTIFLQTLLETYQFGPTAEVMESMKQIENQGNLSDQQIDAIKIAVIEVLKDAGVVGPKAEQKLVDSTKVGVVEALRDTGMLEKDNKDEEEHQMEMAKMAEEMKMKKEMHEMKMLQEEQKMEIEEEKAEVTLGVDEIKAAHELSLKERVANQQARQKEKEAKQNMSLKEKMNKSERYAVRKGAGKNATNRK